MGSTLTLRAARMPDGSVGEIHVVDGVVSEEAGPDAPVLDLGGMLVLPAFAEVHSHLDKAFLADRLPNPTGDLMSAIGVMHTGWPTVTEDDITLRANRAVRSYLAAGVTAIRTHADLNPDAGLKSVRALTRLRDEVRRLVDLQVVALATYLTGPDGATGRRLLQHAIEAGIDVAGSCPHIEEDPAGTIETTLAAAAEAGIDVDLHLDEVLDPDIQHLDILVDSVERHGLHGRVTASHCVSHGLLDPAEQRRIARRLVGAGIAVVTNPRTNLFLQSRGREQAPPRGLTGVSALVEEQVTVAAGSDNIQDPFSVIGRADPLETASLLVSAAHRTVDEATAMVSDAARQVMRVPRPGFVPGAPADFVAVEADSVREAVAEQPATRVVIRAGRIVARTSIDRWMVDD